MSNSYPKTGDGGGSGRVATGQRLRYSTLTSPASTASLGWRFTTGGQSGTPVNRYEIFYDVYLKNASGSDFNYVYRYWYRAVKLESSPQSPVPRWVFVPNSRAVTISVTDVSVRKKIRVDGKDIDLPTLPLTGVGQVGPTVTPYSPSSFGWKGSGQGTQVGSINRGPGGTYFPTANPFGFTGTSPAPGNNSGGGGSEESTSGSDEPGDSSDDPYRSEGPPIPGFNKKRKTFFNPPPVISITGAYVPVVYDWQGEAVRVDVSEPSTRQTLLGAGSYSARIRRKATITQWIQFDDEWRVKQGGSVTDKKGKTTDSWSTDQPLVPNGVRYGFRFTYNPSEVSFQMSPIPGIDPGVIISGLGRSFPMGDEDGGSIQITTYLNRIEDMAFLRPTKNGWGYAGVNPYGNRDIPQEHKTGIATRGTGYDLEYLFRATLGKPYNTQRGIVTADIGLILGLPLLLNLGGGMTYTGRLTGLSYSHMYFTSDMVPTFTQVSMSFTRFPDAVSFNEEPNPGGTGNDKPGSGNKGGKGSSGRR